VEVEPRSDDTGFRPVFEQELTYVWNALRRLGVRPADLEDVTQEVFLRIHHRFSEYDPARPIRAWIFGYAYRCAADYRRLARHRREAPGAEGDGASDPAPLADEQLVLGDRRALLERALDALPIERRAVLILHALEDRPVAEIAEALGIPANTVYSRLRVARVELSDEVKRLRLVSKVEA
jgi:RNA polymerase sigma-70 factor (ECF subfamily)